MEAQESILSIYTSLRSRANLAEDLLPIVERNFRRTKDEDFKRELEQKSGEFSDEIEIFNQIKELDFVRGHVDGNASDTG